MIALLPGNSLASKPIDVVLFVRAYARLIQIDVELRRHGFHQVLKRIEFDRAPARKEVTATDYRRAQRYARRVSEASRLQVIHAECLHRSLALHDWLRSEGLPSQLRIGVLMNDTALEAHAWVELLGYPVNDDPRSVASFTPLALNDEAVARMMTPGYSFNEVGMQS